MTVVSAFLVPGSPLPYVRRDNPPWGRLADAMDAAGRSLAESGAETIVFYSTQWIAVLDQLWQTRERVTGEHVDENWHEFGALPFDMHIDRALATAAMERAAALGIRSKPVDYDQFPVDTGTITASNFLNPGNRLPLVITSNNVYHDWQRTVNIGRAVAEAAAEIGRKAAVVGVGGLSGSIFRQVIDIADDRIASETEDQWNRKILGLLENGDVAALARECPRYAAEARVDMGFKHFAFVLGALGGEYSGATVHGYGPLYGSGGAVIEFRK
jgi:2-aminophenol/2-amino-5-chlorophenol 1,6-dioxygenase alpha subunit